MKELTAVGVTCGIGSMLVGARAAGFEVLGNIEWRKYYFMRDQLGRNTFEQNFPGAIFKPNIDGLSTQEIERLMGADIALGHPECGNFSILGGVNKNYLEKRNDPTDIPLFIELIDKLRPRFFIMDDLPKSFIAFPMSEYARRLPDYDLFPERVCNYGYGNVQKFRNRMFMIGARKEEKWAFVADERNQPGLTLESVIGDLPEPRAGSNYPNHDPCALDERAQKNLSMRFIGDRPTWREVQEYAAANWAEGAVMTYFANDGTVKRKPGCYTERWGGTATVQDGGSYKLHPIRHLPLTLRERARIQGFPDDFVFYGSKLNEAGEYNYDRNVAMAKETGKAMPVQFCRYVSRQIAAHIQGKPFEASGARLLQSDDYVDQAKQWYCENVGYADQPRACQACWLYDRCTIRMRKYQIGEPVVGQRDLIDPGVVPGPDSEHERAAGESYASPARSRGSPAPGPAPIHPRAPAHNSRFVDLPREDEYDI